MSNRRGAAAASLAPLQNTMALFESCRISMYFAVFSVTVGSDMFHGLMAIWARCAINEMLFHRQLLQRVDKPCLMIEANGE